MVTEKQGCGDEGETREVREGKQGKTRGWVSVRRRGDPGEIQGRSMDLGVSVFRSVGGSIGNGNEEGGCWWGARFEDKGERRTREAGVRVRQGRWGVEESLGI